MARDLDAVRATVREIGEGEILFGPQPGWTPAQEYGSVQNGKCGHCQGKIGKPWTAGGLHGYRYCPACSAVRAGDQVILDQQKERTFPPDEDVLAAYAEVVEIRHWKDVPTIGSKSENDEAAVGRALRAGGDLPDYAEIDNSSMVRMSDLDGRTAEAVRQSQRDAGTGRALMGQRPTRRERRAHLQRRSA